MTTHDKHTTRFGERTGSVLSSLWNEFCRLRLVVLDHHDTDAIHDLRVASRRLRATLGLFLPFISGKAVKGISKQIRRITSALGVVRNIDEALIYFSTSEEALPLLLEGLRALRKQEIKVVIRELKTVPCRKMDVAVRAAVAALAESDTDVRLPAYLSEASLQRYQQLYDLLAPAIIPENVAERHGLRIAIKKWRYLLEAIGQVCGQDYGRTLEDLKEYQTLLGSLNDMVEFGHLCTTLMLPANESREVKALLEEDTVRYFARYIEVAASRPLQYTFLL